MCRHRRGVCRGHKGKISEQIAQILWFTEYEEEIVCDFAAIYGIHDMDSLSGPEFVRFARRLVHYEGAVVGQIKMDHMQQDGDGQSVARRDSNVESTTKIKMSDAMSEIIQDEVAALNYESQQAGWGDLFERVTVSDS